MGILPTLSTLLQGKVPGQLVIQFTDRCNATCPQCGMRVTEPFPRSKLSVDKVKRILDKAAETGVKIVSFTGGEPMMYLDDLVALIKHAGNAGIEYIRTGTNGYLFASGKRPGNSDRIQRLAEMLADTPLRNFWISLDSADPAVHERMRGFPGVVAGIEKALPIFHQHGIYPSANLGINRNMGGTPLPARNPDMEEKDYLGQFYEEAKLALRRFYRHTIDLGFTSVNTCYPMSIERTGDGNSLDPVYAANSTAHLVRFMSGERTMLFKALLETVPEFRSRTRVFSPRCSLMSLYRHYGGDTANGYPCRGGIDFFFIESKDADTYPCGFRGMENLGDFCILDRRSGEHCQPCRQCDWECFRDPSELFGPLLQAVTDPWGLLGKIAHDRFYLQTWMEDLRYYFACDLFDGRRPPNYQRLSTWSKMGSERQPGMTEEAAAVLPAIATLTR